MGRRAFRSWSGVMWPVALVIMTAVILNLNVPGVYGKSEKVDLNTASEKELQEVKGIGPATAKKIIAGRPYQSVDDLAKAGISAKIIEAIKPFVKVGERAGAAPKEGPRPSGPGASPKMVSKAGPAKGPIGLIDLNTADPKTLETLPGVGPALSQEIIKGRPYKSIDDLGRVKGIGKAKIDTLRDKVTVGTSSGVASAPSSGPSPAPVTGPPSKTSSAPAATPAIKGPPVSTGQIMPGKKVNINTASKEELDALPGIGQVKAQAIIDGRPYSKTEDIMKVKGIKEETFKKIKDFITVQ